MEQILLETASNTISDLFTLVCIVIYAMLIGYNLHTYY